MVITSKDLVTEGLQHQLSALGHNLKIARKRRKWSIEKVRNAIKCSKGTLENAEKGRATVSLGVYALLIDLYGFDIDLNALTQPSLDTIALSLEVANACNSRKTSPY